ncbi:MAG: biotin--[acetyl-CoA-carboxylase] ligase [Thiothrix sp.]|nr:biotin--[acetyl-CoA-carboxylase] ligase [Thiothrix sp.]
MSLNPLDAEAIRASLSPTVAAALGPIQVFRQLDSTNCWLLEQGRSGDVCLAEAQTAGRGRYGKRWQSPEGNIYCSLRWHFDTVPPQFGCLSLVTGVALAQALEQVGLTGHGLKWPNDLWHQDRKLGGILIQTADVPSQVVIGIGLNVQMAVDTETPIDQPWCQLSDLLAFLPDRNHLLGVMLEQLVPALQRFPAFSLPAFLPEWERRDVLNGRRIRALSGHDTLTGVAMGLDSRGWLRLRDPSGREHAFSSADVSIKL